MNLFAWAALAMCTTPVVAATNVGMRAASSADLTGAPATRTRGNVNYNKYETRTTTRNYDISDGSDLYYTQPSSRSAMYKQYDSNYGTSARRTVRTTRSETTRTEVRRKYYLAHPFFQPLEGKFGSVTDLSYNTNSYDFSLTGTAGLYDASPISATFGQLVTVQGDGSWKSKLLSIKEDFSYGITDKFAIIGMLRYDDSDYKFKWSNGPDDGMDDNGLNMYGVGGQWRFVDTNEWIATVSAYFQHQKDMANSFILDLKAGYKVSRSTIYGLGRGWLVDFDGDSYGNGVEGLDANGLYSLMFLPYATDVSSTLYVEGGLGVFSVLEEDWTLNVEAVFGNYDWHNQASIKGAIGWQPNDWFALNLYAKTVFYDSADGKKLDFYWYRDNLTADAGLLDHVGGLTQFGVAELDKYNETSVGLQVIFQF
ncbi:MAG: hypothetical protein IJ560_02755 [Alphaproteobacteria bacterium]|nr:hypothetical protein [Alphaproteobacteria bacterium]